MAKKRIVYLPGNNALVDVRVLRDLQAAAGFGYEAIAVGIQHRGPDLVEHQVPGGKVLVKLVPQRMGGRGTTHLRAMGRGLGPFSLRAELGTAKAYAKYLASEAQFPAPAPIRTFRQAHALGARALTKTRTVLAPGRAHREYATAEQWERQRIRRLRLLRRLPGLARWRTLNPTWIEAELAVGPLLDQLEPDLIHVHDVYMMGVAVRAKQRAARQGKTIRLVYDSREYVFGQPVVPARIIAAYANLEREFIHHFDQIICVADMMTDQLVQDYHLPQRPALVLNAPAVNHSAPVTPIREVVGLAPDVPLAIYGGGINPVRGIQTAIAALALLPEVHLAVVAREKHWMPPELYQIAEQAGVLERLHVAAFVEHDLVTRYYASADIGLSPLLRVPNHDVTLTNKFCEYLLAGLPIVTSDTPQQAQLVEELDLGAVHRANDPADLARAIRQTLDRLDQLKTRITGDVELQHRFSWEAQVPTLERVYRDAFNKK